MIYTEFITEDNRFFEELESLPFVEKVGATTSLPTSWIMTGLRDNTTGRYENVAFIDGNSSFFEMIGVEILEDTGLGTTMSEDGKWYICKSSKEGISQYMSDGMLNFFTPAPLGGTISDMKIGLVKENAYSKNAFINVIDMPEWIQYAYPVAKVNINANLLSKLSVSASFSQAVKTNTANRKGINFFILLLFLDDHKTSYGTLGCL